MKPKRFPSRFSDDRPTVAQATAALGLIPLSLTRDGKLVPVRNPAEAERDAALPTTAQLCGSDPDFTGDLTTEEYIREIRGYPRKETPHAADKR